MAIENALWRWSNCNQRNNRLACQQSILEPVANSLLSLSPIIFLVVRNFWRSSPIIIRPNQDSSVHPNKTLRSHQKWHAILVTLSVVSCECAGKSCKLSPRANGSKIFLFTSTPIRFSFRCRQGSYCCLLHGLLPSWRPSYGSYYFPLKDASLCSEIATASLRSS